MNTIRHIAAASIVAAIASFGAAGAAQALPASAANIAPPVAADSDSAATPVYHRHRRCWPVHRWVWTHWGWRYRYVGTRCAHPHYRPYWY